jgi:hypothetical protein
VEEDSLMEITEGTELTIDVLEWHEPAWEFGSPIAVLRPVVEYQTDGQSAESVVEDFCIRACVHGRVEQYPTQVEEGLVDRLYGLRTLQRRWAEAWGGKEFPVKEYSATRWHVRFVLDEDEELSFEVEEVEPA